jgi:hypothetical protein
MNGTASGQQHLDITALQHNRRDIRRHCRIQLHFGVVARRCAPECCSGVQCQLFARLGIVSMNTYDIVGLTRMTNRYMCGVDVLFAIAKDLCTLPFNEIIFRHELMQQ